MDHSENDSRFSQPAQIFALVLASCVGIVCVAGLAAILVLARNVFILLLLAVLFSIFLYRVSSMLAERTRLSYQVSLGLVVFALIAATSGSILLFGTQVRDEVAQASKHRDEARRALEQRLARYPAALELVRQVPVVKNWISPEATSELESKSQSDSSEGDSTNDQSSAKQSMSGLSSLASGLVSSIGAALTSTFGLIVSCLVIFFVGLFLAVGPSKSRDGVVVLAAPPYRHETRRVLDKLGHQLWRWLIGRFASMLVTGVGVGVSLGLLGVPMALSLGVATGILTFVPNIGAAIALSLAVLMALPMGMMTVLWVVVIYLAFQLLESYALTPLIQQYQVSIPPALLIGAQAVLGALLGFAGAMIASPVVVVMSVLVHDVYRKHWLGETL